MNRLSQLTLNRNANTFCRLAFSRLLSEQKKKINFDDLVKAEPIVVFMKGTPDSPRCGFSNAVCQILKFHGVNKFSSFDVLEDEDIRQGIKEYTNWPTIPQVFFNGEFLGGCDIMLDMHKNGELIDELQKLGIRSALLDASDEGDSKKDEKS